MIIMKAFKELLKKFSSQKKSEITSNEVNSHDDVPMSKPLFTPPPSYDFFSHPEMSDLAQVGTKKALGYLPLETIRGSGFESFQVFQLLKKKGLKVFMIPNATSEELYAYNPTKNIYVHVADNKEYKVIPKGGFASIRSGALVAYDEEAVNAFLKANEALIDEENKKEPNPEDHWPLVAEDFVNMLFRKKAESGKMNYFVNQVFQEMPQQPQLSPNIK